jgi:predicted nucleic acid-binding protein
MILVDASIWIDHFRSGDQQLAALLSRNEVLTHPCVIGELALGGLKQRVRILRDLNNLPRATAATHAEVMMFADARSLANTGVGYVDACLLASVALTPGAAIWTRDKALRTQAARCALSAPAALV